MSSVEGTPAAPPPETDGADVPKLRRRADNRWIAGVCSGLADYFGLHPAVYRVLFVALAFAGGTGILLYVAAALVMPVEGNDESAATAFLRSNRERPWLVIGLSLLALLLIAVLTNVGGGDGDFGGMFFLLLLAGAVALVGYGSFILAPAWASYGRLWERVVAALLTAFTLASLLGIGAALGLAIVWSYDRFV